MTAAHLPASKRSSLLAESRRRPASIHPRCEFVTRGQLSQQMYSKDSGCKNGDGGQGGRSGDGWGDKGTMPEIGRSRDHRLRSEPSTKKSGSSPL